MDAEEIFKYNNNLNKLKIMLPDNILERYKYLKHILDYIGIIGIGIKFLQPEIVIQQKILKYRNGNLRITLTKYKEKHYVIFTRTKNREFQTRLTMDGVKINRQEHVKLEDV